MNCWLILSFIHSFILETYIAPLEDTTTQRRSQPSHDIISICIFVFTAHFVGLYAYSLSFTSLPPNLNLPSGTLPCKKYLMFFPSTRKYPRFFTYAYVKPSLI